MNFETILSSIITSTSILIAVGFPFLIFIATNYKTRKGKLLFELKAYYPKLNAFRELISYVSTAGIVKDYDRLIKKAGTKNEKEEIEKNDAYSFYKAINYISNKYNKDIVTQSIHRRIYSYEEVEKYLLYSNLIWYNIDCRTDIIKELNISRFEELPPHEKEKIKNKIISINANYSNNKITIGLIASVAGEIETEIADPLAYLTKEYEKPLPSLVKKLFITLTLSLIIGVFSPLLLLQFQNLQSCWTSIAIVFMIIICFILIVIFMGKYIWTIQNK